MNLSDIAYSRFLLRHGQTLSKWEKRIELIRLSRLANMLIKRWRHGNKGQRDMINRRQRKAQAQGVQLWNTIIVCGEEFAIRKW
jgi:hypothetical protein